VRQGKTLGQVFANFLIVFGLCSSFRFPWLQKCRFSPRPNLWMLRINSFGLGLHRQREKHDGHRPSMSLFRFLMFSSSLMHLVGWCSCNVQGLSDRAKCRMCILEHVVVGFHGQPRAPQLILNLLGRPARTYIVLCFCIGTSCRRAESEAGSQRHTASRN
jgi:hypothetical protein